MEEKSPPRAEKSPPGGVQATSWAQGRSKVRIGSHSGSTPGAPGSAPEGPRALLILTGREHIDKTKGFLTFENRARALLILRSALKKGRATNGARLTWGWRGVDVGLTWGWRGRFRAPGPPTSTYQKTSITQAAARRGLSRQAISK